VNQTTHRRRWRPLPGWNLSIWAHAFASGCCRGRLNSVSRHTTAGEDLTAGGEIGSGTSSSSLSSLSSGLRESGAIRASTTSARLWGGKCWWPWPTGNAVAAVEHRKGQQGRKHGGLHLGGVEIRRKIDGYRCLIRRQALVGDRGQRISVLAASPPGDRHREPESCRPAIQQRVNGWRRSAPSRTRAS